ncbi:MAG: dihydrolipoyl dehydrogenase [Candidatus Poribacteria bacterium]|nr:dihydrolipoyl dehydrogenase [Candidatus Poribacteria bacterium]MDE0503313.1 dihydrolipoyl dehydrogenase [Candidatus Poribacteria bacterium]
MSTFDVAVIGGGPGGYVAAIKAAQLGGTVCLIEQGDWGGTCLNRGCIPTKTLYAVANLMTQVHDAGGFGIKIQGAEIDYPQVLAHKNETVAKLTKGIGQLLKANRVHTVNGFGRLTGSNTIEVDTSEGSVEHIHASRIIIATGSEPANIPIFEIDERQVLTTTGVLELHELPKSLIIIGGGVSGCEFASIFNGLGTEITVLELLPTILATEDTQVVRHVQQSMKRKGITIKTGANVTHVEKSEAGVTAKLESGEEFSAQKMLISIGRQLNSENIGLERAGVQTEKGKIIVDERMETSVPGVYAVGDVCSRYALAHVASAEGVVAARNCMGEEAEMDYGTVPWCVFTIPEIARVGMTEDEAASEGYEVKVGRFPYAASGKAIGMRETDGFVKIVSDSEAGDILGAHIVGAHASDLIHEAVVAIGLGATVEELAHTIHAHPTLGEAVMESAEAAYDRAIHIM